MPDPAPDQKRFLFVSYNPHYIVIFYSTPAAGSAGVGDWGVA